MHSRVESHPQKQKIIDAMIAGRPLREIAAWTDPRVSVMALQRYRAGNVTPAMAHADTYTRILKKQKVDIPLPTGADLVRGAIQSAPVLAIREKRLGFIQDRHNRLQRIIEERAEEMDGEVAGGGSGLLVRDYKGKNADQAVYKVDTGLLAECREHEKQVAIELGQWQESSVPSIAVQIVCPVVNGVTAVPAVPPEAVEIGIVQK